MAEACHLEFTLLTRSYLGAAKCYNLCGIDNFLSAPHVHAVGKLGLLLT